MDLPNELERITGLLRGERIDFALCGGLAVNVYGHVRATRDIDLLVERASIDRIRDAVKDLGFTLRSGRIPFGVRTPAEREVWPVSKPEGASLSSLDLLAVTPIFASVWAGRREVDWRGRSLGIVSLEGLASMKRLAGRKQDLADLEALGLESSP